MESGLQGALDERVMIVYNNVNIIPGYMVS